MSGPSFPAPLLTGDFGEHLLPSVRISDIRPTAVSYCLSQSHNRGVKNGTKHNKEPAGPSRTHRKPARAGAETDKKCRSASIIGTWPCQGGSWGVWGPGGGLVGGTGYWPVYWRVYWRVASGLSCPVSGRQTGRGTERVAGSPTYWTGVQRVRVDLDNRPRFWDSPVGEAGRSGGFRSVWSRTGVWCPVASPLRVSPVR